LWVDEKRKLGAGSETDRHVLNCPQKMTD